MNNNYVVRYIEQTYDMEYPIATIATGHGKRGDKYK